jgi:hypothetical protein
VPVESEPAPNPSPAPPLAAVPERIHVQAVAPAGQPEVVLEPAAYAPLSPEPAGAKWNRSIEPAPGPAHTSSAFDEKEPIEMPSHRRGGSRAVFAAIFLIALAGGGTLAARYFTSTGATTGTLAVTTNPPGAQVLIDGQPYGVSPTTLTVTPGPHVLELRGAGDPRSIPLTVAAGAQLSQYIELGKSQVASVGSLQVRTEPAGAAVSVDGTPRGLSPIIIADLLPGEHTVVVETDAGSTKQTVRVEAGAMASLVAQLPAQAGPASGWISVSTPRPVQLFEDGRLLGSSDSERLMVATGAHRLDIVNEALGYRGTKTVHVAPGKVSSITVEFPKGTIALNAVPWADVWIDGEKVGETPIGNLPVTIGSHEIIFRHPDLGEQRHVTTVTLAAPARVSVDMRKKP